jgi:hypothetical protein
MVRAHVNGCCENKCSARRSARAAQIKRPLALEVFDECAPHLRVCARGGTRESETKRYTAALGIGDEITLSKLS